MRASDADRYVEHQAGTGVRDFRATPGNRGALVLRRAAGDRVEIMAVSFWESMEAVKAFAGERPELARFYPGDDELLVEKDLLAEHFEVVSADLDDLSRPDP